jgi:formylmethanofuran dehydrogenase subunit A
LLVRQHSAVAHENDKSPCVLDGVEKMVSLLTRYFGLKGADGFDMIVSDGPDGWIVCERPGRIFYVAPPYVSKIEEDVRQHFRKANTVSFDNYSILAKHLPLGEMIPCG